jgi:hypothetical protein
MDTVVHHRGRGLVASGFDGEDTGQFCVSLSLEGESWGEGEAFVEERCCFAKLAWAFRCGTAEFLLPGPTLTLALSLPGRGELVFLL